MKVTHLNASIKPLSDGIDPPSERLPEPNWINVTHEEYEKMFNSIDFHHLTLNDCKNIDMAKIMKETEEKLCHG